MDACLPTLATPSEWAKAASPSQLITAGWWHDDPASSAMMFENSDVVTFRWYGDAPALETKILELAKMGRPMICTEYMARTRNSLFETCLPVFEKHRVGAVNWGLVKGKTHTIFAWDTPLPTVDEPPVWFHDIFRPDGTPYSQKEVDFIKAVTSKNRTRSAAAAAAAK